MASTAGQPQFRYTQPPSKVLHVRNLPWECSEEELIELCKPFGKVVNTKVNVGANHNQAFVEFADLNQAIAMVSYYASSSEPAQVRGKTVYLQYSNRQEIVTSKNSGDVASNVLLVTIEGVEAGDVSIDVLHLVKETQMSGKDRSKVFNATRYHEFQSRFVRYSPEKSTAETSLLVFSAFGFVHKIATFEKSAGFQALVQFSDANTASAAKSALEGRSIPRYLLPDHVGPCHLRISFSAHNDLNVKFQSHRSRDYTNPYLPVAPSAIDGGGQFSVGPDGKRREPESNVLLVSIENMQYAVTIDVIHTVFSAFGFVQKIAIFEKSAGFQALVQYPDIPTAVGAKEALEGHCIYDGGFCKLHLSYSRHTDLNVKVNNDRSRDYTNPGLPPTQPPVLGQSPGVGSGSPAAAGPGYQAAAQYGGGPPQDSGAQQQAWDAEVSGKAQQVSGPMQGQPMSAQQSMYMNHQHGGAAGHSGHHGPPGAPGSYQGPPGAVTSMSPMSGPLGMGGGPMGPPGHMGSGMHQQGQQNHPMGPPGHSMAYQQMHGPGHQGMPPSNGGPGGYYM